MKILRNLRSYPPAFFRDEEGSAVLEVVIVIAVLLAVAVLFNNQLRGFADKLFTSVFAESNVFSVLK